MAYGTNQPFGISVVKSLVSGSGGNNVTTRRIATTLDGLTTYASNIFYGDPVAFNTVAANLGGGTIMASAVGGGIATSVPIGVFLGCGYYARASGIWTHSNFWPASTQVVAGSSIEAYVDEDPFALLEVQVSSYDTTSATGPQGIMLQSMIGQNCQLSIGNSGNAVAPANPTTGNTTTGYSGFYLNLNTAAATSTLIYKIMGFSPCEANLDRISIDSTTGLNTTAFLNAIVKFNVHQFGSVGTPGIVAA